MKKLSAILVLLVFTTFSGCSTKEQNKNGLGYLGEFLTSEKQNVTLTINTLINTLIEVECRRYDEYLNEARRDIQVSNNGEEAIQEYISLTNTIETEKQKIKSFYNSVREYLIAFEDDKFEKAVCILEALQVYNNVDSVSKETLFRMDDTILDVLKNVNVSDIEGSPDRKILNILSELEKHINETVNISNNGGS